MLRGECSSCKLFNQYFDLTIRERMEAYGTAFHNWTF